MIVVGDDGFEKGSLIIEMWESIHVFETVVCKLRYFLQSPFFFLMLFLMLFLLLLNVFQRRQINSSLAMLFKKTRRRKKRAFQISIERGNARKVIFRQGRSNGC